VAERGGATLDADSDLLALAEARAKARAAHVAWQQFAGVTQEAADRIVAAMSEAAASAARELAELAVEETGYGVVEDKFYKNLYNARFVAESMVGMKTIGVLWVDEANRMAAVGSPMGVIAAIVPVTNPTSTVIFKCLAAVKSGNAIVCAPHPRATRCCNRAAKIMADAAERAGAPPRLIACLENVTLASTQELMRHPDVALVLATGGSGMVRAAYSSEKPTLAVGPGNVPVYVDRSVADVSEAALMIVTSKSFDNGTACVAEQSVVLDAPIADRTLAAFAQHGTAMLAGDAARRLEATLFTERGELRPDAVGLSAVRLAEKSGIVVDPKTRVLGVELDRVGEEVPLSKEILGPVLSFYRVADAEAGYRRCAEILALGGAGHTLGLHAEDDAVIARFSSLPASRILCNTPSLFGGMGFSCATDPSFMLGTGTWSGSIVSDNVTALHLINIKRVAHEVRPWRSLYDLK
jgi:acetaldehyde dehydrogenase (acetylating)